MQILLVYERLPEESKLYLFDSDDLTATELKNLAKCHGHFGNTIISGENAEEIEKLVAEWLPGFLEFYESFCTSGDESKPTVIHGPVKVILSGFVL